MIPSAVTNVPCVWMYATDASIVERSKAAWLAGAEGGATDGDGDDAGDAGDAPAPPQATRRKVTATRAVGVRPVSRLLRSTGISFPWRPVVESAAPARAAHPPSWPMTRGRPGSVPGLRCVCAGRRTRPSGRPRAGPKRQSPAIPRGFTSRGSTQPASFDRSPRSRRTRRADARSTPREGTRSRSVAAALSDGRSHVGRRGVARSRQGSPTGHGRRHVDRPHRLETGHAQLPQVAIQAADTPGVGQMSGRWQEAADGESKAWRPDLKWVSGSTPTSRPSTRSAT